MKNRFSQQELAQTMLARRRTLLEWVRGYPEVNIFLEFALGMPPKPKGKPPRGRKKRK